MWNAIWTGHPDFYLLNLAFYTHSAGKFCSDRDENKNWRQQKTITSYLLPWFQVALGFQGVIGRASIFSLLRAGLAWERWKCGKQILQSCPLLLPAPRCHGNKAGLDEGRSEVLFAINLSPAAASAHPLSSELHRWQLKKETTLESQARRQSSLNSLSKLANRKTTKSSFRVRGGRGNSRYLLFLTWTLWRSY